MVETLIASAQKYYDFLETNGLGVEKIRIKSQVLEDNQLILHLRHKLFSTDGLILKCNDELLEIGSEESVRILSYSEQALVLVLEFYIPTQRFENQSFELLSDLKFLVKNVENFFASQEIAFPSKAPIILQEDLLCFDELSQEQTYAIRKIFAFPLTYIWGAPGSGKTQRVLFQAVLHLLKNGKRIALIAPTNNALEQASKTLIKKFDELGLNRELILRLGIPTAEFALLYPEVCESNPNRDSNLFTSINPKERIKEAQVFALTLDGFIKRYEGLGIVFDHIFLDECAFAPLIKVCALCANPSPLTLLGDHKQLMPVCEMPQREIEKNEEVRLWNLSALFLEPFFQGESLQKSPNFEKTKISILRQTHRYGDNLAKVLDEFIYKNGLSGSGQISNLYYLDCSKLQAQNLKGELHPTQTSPQEIVGAKQIFSSLQDCAIITPFVKQRQALVANGLPYESVFTIHGSQGQEFESIIFSPVALHFHLTDSRNQNALYALNVAISRMKKNLVIVCDYAMWCRQDGQFISHLLKIAKPYEFSQGLNLDEIIS